VNGDNTVVLENRVLQIDKTRWRNTLAGCTVQVYELLDGQIVIRYGPHEVGRFARDSVAEVMGKQKRSARPLGHKRAAAA
jgi:hypothetical protein